MAFSLADLEARLSHPDLLDGGVAVAHDASSLFEHFLVRVESGEVRAARRDEHGRWHAVPWVKRGILLGFRIGRIVEMGSESSGLNHFLDKHTFPVREFRLEHGVRIVPGGSAVRSCAQIGERVHLSAAAQIGGVLEPINASPVIIENDVIVGGNCGVYEGTVVRERAVLGAGVILTRGTPVYDLVKETVHRATADVPLEIPSGAVVVPGARRVSSGWGAEQGIALQTPVIVKYRDEKTDAATALEAWLR